MKPLAKAMLQLALLGSTFWVRPGSSAEELVVIVNPASGVASLSRAQLSPLFLTKSQTLPGGERASPVNLPEGTVERSEFDRVVLGMDRGDAARYWIDRKIRGGARPPPKVTSAQSVVSHVESTKGGIGYVPSGSTSDRVRVVARLRGGRVLSR